MSTVSHPVKIEPIRAFSDNYIWLLTQGARAVVVDPGDEAPVLRIVAERRLQLVAILATHHHGDHVGGVEALVKATGAKVYGPRGESIPCITERLGGADRIDVLEHEFVILDVPGHTRGHIAYHAPSLGAVFCGDTLFACGCGRLFEGTAEQMTVSLAALARLPAATRVYCAHEYTLSNIRFALAVEPDNTALQQRQRACERLRAAGEPTVPSTIGDELATNPFLRCDEPAVRASARLQAAGAAVSSVATFAALRAWKDRY